MKENLTQQTIQINFYSSLVEFCFVLGVRCGAKTRLYGKPKLAMNYYAMENDLMGWSCHDLSSNGITSPCQLTKNIMFLKVDKVKRS